MNAITDLRGFRVGQVERVGDGWLTGVTVIVPPPGTIGAVAIHGAAPATHEVAALHSGAASPTPQAIVLTGGSSFGLISVHGVARRLVEEGLGYEAGPRPHEVIPLVPAAAIYDLGRGGDFGATPTVEMGYAACAQALTSPDHAPVRRGNVGAGAGAALYDERYKGGLGTASASVSFADGIAARVGALAVVNAYGAPLTPSGEPACAATVPPHPGFPPAANTTLVIVATDARLDPGVLHQTAVTAHDGLARSIDPVHTFADGDAVFALSTGAVHVPGEDERFRHPRLWRDHLIALQAVAARVVAAAIRDGIRSASPIITPTFTLPNVTDV